MENGSEQETPISEFVICGTGHRPDKLGGYTQEAFDKLVDFCVCTLAELPVKPTKVISGMALGFDLALAMAAWSLNIPFVAAVPFIGQEKLWKPAQREFYTLMLSRAASIEVVSPGEYSAWKMQVRNIWMVDHADAVLALWDGKKGGTANCVYYAERKKKQIINVWEQYESHE